MNKQEHSFHQAAALAVNTRNLKRNPNFQLFEVQLLAFVVIDRLEPTILIAVANSVSN